jgi:hypothetical protein
LSFNVDESTNYCWIFLKAKSELKQKMPVLLTDLKIVGVNVKLIQYDDSWRNKVFQQECKSMGFNIKFEFFRPKNTPA